MPFEIQYLDSTISSTTSLGFPINVGAALNSNGQARFFVGLETTGNTFDFDNGIIMSDLGVVSFNSAGKALWAAQGVNSVNSLADDLYNHTVDCQGNSYLFGSFRNTITFGKFVLTAVGDPTIVGSFFVTKISPCGEFLWVQQFTIEIYDPKILAFGRGLTISNNVVSIAGYFFGTLTLGSKTYTSGPAGANYILYFDACTGVPNHCPTLITNIGANAWVIPTLYEYSSAQLPVIKADSMGNIAMISMFDTTITLGKTVLTADYPPLTIPFGPFDLVYGTSFISKYDPVECKWLWGRSIQRGTPTSINGTNYLTEDNEGNIIFTTAVAGTNTFNKNITVVSDDYALSPPLGLPATSTVVIGKLTPTGKYCWVDEISFTSSTNLSTIFGQINTYPSLTTDDCGNIYATLSATNLDGTLAVYRNSGCKRNRTLVYSKLLTDTSAQVIVLGLTNSGKTKFLFTGDSNTRSTPLVVSPFGKGIFTTGNFTGGTTFGSLTVSSSTTLSNIFWAKFCCKKN